MAVDTVEGMAELVMMAVAVAAGANMEGMLEGMLAVDTALAKRVVLVVIALAKLVVVATALANLEVVATALANPEVPGTTPAKREEAVIALANREVLHTTPANLEVADTVPAKLEVTATAPVKQEVDTAQAKVADMGLVIEHTSCHSDEMLAHPRRALYRHTPHVL